jgi:16S rRNA (cytosine967-C5)-methyltransferase
VNGSAERPRPTRDGQGLAARRAALEVLAAVEEDGTYANLVLPSVLDAAGLEGRDAALTTDLVAGTLRGQGTLDLVLDAASSRPVTALDPPVRRILRLGAYQLLDAGTAPHAAVSTAVALAKQGPHRRAAPFVNAVLRRVATADRATWVARVAPDPAVDPIGALAVEHAHPRWVVDALLDALDGDEPRLVEELAANNERPAVTLAVRRDDPAVRAELDAAGCRPGRWASTAAVLPAGRPGALAAVRSGAVGVQDEGSQVVTLALAGLPIDGRDARWLDACAGPGGKAALLAALAADRPALLLAAERHPHRARLVRQALREQGGSAGVVAADSTAGPWRPASFDRVLLDAPCTGLGALRRRPEARWRRTAEDLERLVALQRVLLASALDAVRPGGLVGYVTCSPLRAETIDVVDAVLRGRPDAEQVPLDGLHAAVPGSARGPAAQLWPGRHGTDAMFLAVLRRR